MGVLSTPSMECEGKAQACVEKKTLIRTVHNINSAFRHRLLKECVLI